MKIGEYHEAGYTDGADTDRNVSNQGHEAKRESIIRQADCEYRCQYKFLQVAGAKFP